MIIFMIILLYLYYMFITNVITISQNNIDEEEEVTVTSTSPFELRKYKPTKASLNYNYPKSLIVDEITLVVTKSGNMKIKVSVTEKTNNNGLYIERILLNSSMNEYDTDDNVYIVDVDRKDAKIITDNIIRDYYNYKGRIYFQEVNVISNEDDNETLEYTYISRSSFTMRI